MSVIVERVASTPHLADAPARAFSVSITGFDAIEPCWRALEARGLATPYQRFDWVRPYVAHAMTPREGKARIVEVRGADGSCLAILPLAVRRRLGFVTASLIGGKHANFHMPVMDRGFAARLTPAAARALLADVAAALGGVDDFTFRNQPVSWDGAPNPFAALSPRPSPSNAYKLPLLGDCEATLRDSMSSHARKKHKNKRARFMELGPSRMFIAETPAERERVLEAFYRQKALRFAEMGVADPFAPPGVRAFLRAASTPGLGEPALRLGALELNGAIVSTYVGAVHGERFSGMATSFEPDPAVTKVSPGEILLVDMIRNECRGGRRVFDLGVGEARYKTTICNQTEPLADSFVAMTLKGRVAAAALRAAGQAKGAIKHSPLAFSIYRKLSRRRADQTG